MRHAMFNHSNVRLPAGLDRLLRCLVVTPDMHRVHHSIEDDETNSNFGFNLPWWDRLFGTYRDQPRGGHEAMTIGIRTFRDDNGAAGCPACWPFPSSARYRITPSTGVNGRSEFRVTAQSGLATIGCNRQKMVIRKLRERHPSARMRSSDSNHKRS